MLIRCASFISAGNTVANSPVIHVPVSSARHFAFSTAGSRGFVAVTQLDDDPTIGIPASFGIVPPPVISGWNVSPHPGWNATDLAVLAVAQWWNATVEQIGQAG